MLELKSFARVELWPGESTILTFDVPVGQLGFHDRSLDHTVEPDAAGVQPDTAFDGTVRIA